MYFYAFLSIVIMFVIAFYLQFYKGIEPCPLCILQRIDLGILGLLFLFGAACRLKNCSRIFIGALGFIFSLLGVFLAGRQVWIQHLPPNQSADCGVSFQYLMHVLPWDQLLKKIFEGTAECSLIDWSLWGFSMAEWSLAWFIIFALFTSWQMIRK
jgi:disulfide bond formation protein DsbB